MREISFSDLYDFDFTAFTKAACLSVDGTRILKAISAAIVPQKVVNLALRLQDLGPERSICACQTRNLRRRPLFRHGFGANCLLLLFPLIRLFSR